MEDKIVDKILLVGVYDRFAETLEQGQWHEPRYTLVRVEYFAQALDHLNHADVKGLITAINVRTQPDSNPVLEPFGALLYFRALENDIPAVMLVDDSTRLEQRRFVREYCKLHLGKHPDFVHGDGTSTTAECKKVWQYLEHKIDALMMDEG